MKPLRLLAPLLLVGLLGGAALADDETTYLLHAREDLIRDVRVKLVLTVKDGAVHAVRTATYAHGGEQVLVGDGTLEGADIAIRFTARKGARNLLMGPTPNPIRASYKLNGKQLSGLLYDPDRVAGWSFALERGRAASPAPEAATPTRPREDTPIRPATPTRPRGTRLPPTSPPPAGPPARGAEATYSPAPGRAPLQRVVWCLDGIPYRVMKRLYEQGLFKGFRAPGRLISVFPSLSSISWNSILGLPPEPGYQAVYYSNSLNKSMGVTMRKMQGSRFQTRVHYRHTGIVGHALAYVMPYGMGTRQLKELVHEVLEHKSSKTAFVYAYQTDPIAHMAGRPKLERILKDFDGELKWLQREYRRRWGEDLEMVIVSDHGHTLVSGQLVKLSKHLKRHGWKFSKNVKKKNQASFTTAGILASIALTCQEQQEAELARIVATMPGVDVCTWDEGGVREHVVSRKGEGLFEYDSGREAFRYSVARGSDPIGYLAVYARLRRARKLTPDGFAYSRDLFQATVDHQYPDAPARIRRGHTSLVRNPANVLVSLKDAYENGAGMVKLTASLRGRSGTHGGLNQHCSAGIFMTNYRPRVPAIRTRDFGHYVDLGDYLANDPPVELTAAPHVGVEKLATPEAPEDGVRPGLWLEMRDTSAASHQAGVRTTIAVTVERVRFLLWDKQLWKGSFDRSRLTREADTWVMQLPDSLTRKLKAGKTYRVELKLEHRDARGRVLHQETRKLKLGYRGTYQIFD